MVWAPKEETQEAIKFWLECLQVVTVILGLITVVVTVNGYWAQQAAAAIAQAERVAEQDKRAREQEKAQAERVAEQDRRAREQEKAQAERVAEQDRRAREQEAAIRRELRHPYDEKKLNLYLEASQVVAHLAATPTIEKDAYEARFWELYWGELAFVESTTSGENRGGPTPSIERLMVEFCHEHFPGKCSKEPSEASLGVNGSAKLPTGNVAAAIRLARQASQEIRYEWENLTNAKFCQTTIPDGTLNNRDCSPKLAPPNPSKTPPAPN